jgi:prepilin signal peptidase PulO-like enzyme (type II secretory pathway)
MPLAPPSSWQVVFPWAETAVIGFAFVWGAMLGSFLNVVVHRLPRGESVVRGRSRCPRCGAAVRPRDNVPVLGWLLLRGRCRDCAAPIAARYPLVEAACGLIVAALAAVDLVWGGVDRMLLHGEWLPWARFALHTTAALVAVAWWLLAAAGTGCPSWLPPLAAAAGILAVAVPSQQPTGVLPDGTGWPQGQPRLAAGVAWLAGIIAGGVARAAIGREGGGPLPLLGAVFGWQAVTVVAAVMGIVRRGGRSAGTAPPAGD